MSYHGVGANGPTDYEPSYETQPAEPPRYNALQPYPWDAGAPRDWPPRGIVGPSGEYSTAGFRLPRAGMGADAAMMVNVSPLPALAAGAGAFVLAKYVLKQRGLWGNLGFGVLFGWLVYKYQKSSAEVTFWDRQVKALESATLPPR